MYESLHEEIAAILYLINTIILNKNKLTRDEKDALVALFKSCLKELGVE